MLVHELEEWTMGIAATADPPGDDAAAAAAAADADADAADAAAAAAAAAAFAGVLFLNCCW